MTVRRHAVKTAVICLAGWFVGTLGVSAAVSGSINDNIVNIRSGSSTTADVVMTVDKGQAITIVASEGEFYKISVKDKSNVYVHKQFATIKETAGEVNDSGVNVRKAPSRSAEAVGCANYGEIYGVSAKDGDWYCITFNGSKAYISKDFLEGKNLGSVKDVAAAKEVAKEAAVQEKPKEEPAKQEQPKEEPPKQEQPKEEPPKQEVTAEETPKQEQPKEEVLIAAEPEPVSEAAVIEMELAKLDTKLPYAVPEELDVTPESGDPLDAYKAAEAAEKAEQERANEPDQPETIYAVVKSDTSLRLREEPSVEANVLKLLAPGEAVDVLEVSNDWVKVVYSGKYGYVNAEYVEVARGVKPVQSSSARDNKVQPILDYARQFLGTPYSYGGTNLTSGVDCSGFVYSVLKHFGISIGRSSRDMAQYGRPISRDELMAGDLVFFSANGTIISHVAMYIGNGQYIHSTDAKGRGVSYASLNDSYGSRTYYSARRIIE